MLLLPGSLDGKLLREFVHGFSPGVVVNSRMFVYYMVIVRHRELCDGLIMKRNSRRKTRQ